MTGLKRYFFQRCPEGHMQYWKSDSAATDHDKFCWLCGKEYIRECNHCGALLENSFTAWESALDGKPMQTPRRSSFCGRCGKVLPWAEKEHKKIEETGVWSLLHTKVTKTGKSRFESGHYADSVEAAFKELNAVVKSLYREVKSEELDGPDLMRKAFRLSDPVIILDDRTTSSGQNIQEGYSHIFAGAMQAIRNPKAHANIDISADEAIHLLMFASLLFHRLDSRRPNQP